MKARKRRDRASDLITGLFLVVEALAKRMGVMEWNDRAPTSEEEDDDQENEPRIEVSLSEALALSGQQAEYDDHLESEADVQELRHRVKELEAQRLDFFRSIIRYTTNGCKSAEDVTKKWLALVRRVDPHSLRDIGMSQAAVARALGERRATTSAREMREFEVPMRMSGARGYQGTGGLRSETNRRNCSKAQQGNNNRAKGHAASQMGDENSNQHLRISGGGKRTKRSKKAKSRA